MQLAVDIDACRSRLRRTRSGARGGNPETVGRAVIMRKQPLSRASTQYDLVVVGGGPSGSTVATLVAMQGHRVLLIERCVFPRHQIGESLLPATVHGICPLLGVSEKLEGAGFFRKYGGTFLWGRSTSPWTFSFTRTLNSRTGYAYQVERSKFDQILLENAQDKGVVVEQGIDATEILFEAGAAVGVRCRTSQGDEREYRGQFVVDASGFASPFHRLVGRRLYSKFFKNISIYAYFENGKRLPPPNTGNIFSAAFSDGWFWYIPLTDTLTSVGAVVSREAAGVIRDGHDAAFRYFLQRCPAINEWLQGARRVTEGPYGQYRIRKDYSYCNARFYRDRLILIGDSACFVDPVFSSGVHLGTYAGLLAARSVNSCLKGVLPVAECFREFELRYRREFANFYQFLSAFYDMHKDRESYFWEAHKVLSSEASPDDAFVRLVSGLSDTTDPVLSAQQFLLRPATIGEWLQASVADGALRTEQSVPPASQSEPEEFMDNLLSEIKQVQVQALFGEDRPPESPLVHAGLVPTSDGLHWARVAS